MSYIVPIHTPTSVRHAVKLNLLDEEQECLVLAKSNWLEIWRQTTTGLVLDEHKRFQIHGKITMLSKVSLGPSKYSQLFVGTANRQYFTLSWNSETNKLQTEQTFEDVSDPSMRDAQTLNKCLVDPTGQYYCLCLYEGALSVIKQKRPKRGLVWTLDVPEQIRIAELDVTDSTFLYSHGHPKLALLHQYGKSKTIEMVVYQVWDGKTYSTFEKADREDTVNIKDGGARHLIPVPQGEELVVRRRHVSRINSGSEKKKPLLGGVIVVGETTLTYYDDASKLSEIYALPRPNIFVAWTAMDDLRYLLADEFGGLHLLTVITDGNEVTNMEVIKMGSISMPTTMILLENDLLFIASHVGDSQLVKLNFPKNRLPTIKLIQSLNNIGPILDFSIMDLGQAGTEVGARTRTHEFSSGQARIVAGCGAYESGSLQSIRSGIGIEDFGLLGEMANVKGLFPLHISNIEVGGSVVDDTLVISFVDETRVFRFDSGGDIEELAEFMNFPMNEQTMLATNVDSGILHVTPQAVRLIEPESGMVIAMFDAGDQHITAVSSTKDVALVCVGGAILTALDLNNALQQKEFDFNNGEQIACIHVPSIRGSPVAFIGFWNSATISVLSLDSMDTIHRAPLTTQNAVAVPRSLVMAQLLPPTSSSPTVLVAMSDGVVISFDFSPTTYALSKPTSVALGTQHAALTVIPASDSTKSYSLQHVFATCELSTLIHAAENRIMYSAVTADDATAVCPFNTVYFPHTIVTASPREVKISVLDSERVTHVKKLPLGETVRRIAYLAKERCFGVGAVKRAIVDNVEVVSSEFRCVDEASFQVLGKPFKLGYKGSEEMVETVIATRFATSYGEPQERFVVGTSFLETSKTKNGRILVLGVDSTNSPYLIAQHALKGSCNRLGMVDGKLVAALTKTVTVWEYEESNNVGGELKMVASFRTASTPIDLAVNGNNIAISDMMKSVSVLEYRRGEKGMNPTLVEVARDWDNRWGTAVGHIDESTYVGADGSGNLKVLKYSPNRNLLPYEQEAADNKRLENVGEYHLGENVTCIRSFEVKATEDAIVIPRAFLSTAEGSVYVLSTVRPSHLPSLLLLQQKILEHLQTLGKMVTWEIWRALSPTPGTPLDKIKEAPEGFVDGEVIEKFLVLDEAAQVRIVQDVAAAEVGQWQTVNEVRKIVEDLKRLR